VAFEIIVAPTALEQIKRLRPDVRSRVRDAIERHLRHEPTKVSKSRIKRLRGLKRPEYRLRVDEERVFYDVEERAVHVLAVVSKAQAQEWLDAEGLPTPQSSPGKNKG
jgi:mRNA-degrading endonuclease RelE of RelBE toxin-antitoxin system